MKEYVTEHTKWCKVADNSRVMWDEETNVTRCLECGALTEERDTEVEAQMMPEGSNGEHLS